MFLFPDLDEQTRLVMVSELALDLSNSLFYEPASMTDFGRSCYRSILKSAFEIGTAETLSQKLTSNFFHDCDRVGRKLSPNIALNLAFSDFNRYYVRAMLVRAISENKKLVVYRAKQSKNERQESKMLLNHVYFDKRQMAQMLVVFRDYHKLFAMKSQNGLLQPNSGLSLRFPIT